MATRYKQGQFMVGGAFAADGSQVHRPWAHAPPPERRPPTLEEIARRIEALRAQARQR